MAVCYYFTYMDIQKKIIIFLFSTLVSFGMFPFVSYAANLYLSPPSGSFSVGKSFTASIYVSSTEQAMNAASGVVLFPSDKLQVMSLSKDGSIISLWVQEPSFSNTAGTINFEGIALNPGFIGATGKVININFRVIDDGVAPITFSSGSVLANDGKGTNILENLVNANFSLVGMTPSLPVAPSENNISSGLPPAPKIFSLTHPDFNKWYSEDDAEFTWDLPSGTTGSRLLIGEIPEVIPTVTYIPPIKSKSIPDMSDGVWYFHVRLRNDAGWGASSHFKLQIDTEKPSRFYIDEIRRNDMTEPKVKFAFDAEDETSGVDYYEVVIDDSDPQVWRDDSMGTYETPLLLPGKHIMKVKAIDKAGNSIVSSVEFNIDPISAPVITEYSKEVESGENISIKGSTIYPKSEVVIWIEKDKEDAKSYAVKTDKDGVFEFTISDKVENGVYMLWAEVTDPRGARSGASDKVIIKVKTPAIFKFGATAISLLAVVIPLVALIIVLIFIVAYGLHKFAMFRKKLRKEVNEAEFALRKAFGLLKENVKEQIKFLEKVKTKRGLTAEEDKIIAELKTNLDNAEKFVRKEIKDIEREIK